MENKEIQDLKEDVRWLDKRVYQLSKLVEILMKGHETERKHKNIFKRMYKKVIKFHKGVLKDGK